jgi:hypothetical protein
VSLDTACSVLVDQNTVDDVLEILKTRKGNLSCSEMCALLTGLGFVVRRCKTPNHYVFNHPRLAGWYGSDFCGEHGKNGTINWPYVRQVIRVIEAHSQTLKRLLGEPR